MMYNYPLFNSSLQSELALPKAEESMHNNVLTDPISLRFHSVARDGLTNYEYRGLCYQATPSQFWLNVPKVARYLIQQGNEILIDLHKETNFDSVRTFLYYVCLSILARQRNLTVLMGDALCINNHGIGFLGTGSVGQNMLIGLLLKMDCQLLSSHEIFIENNRLHASLAPFILLPSVAHFLGLPLENLKKIRADVDKYIHPTTPHCPIKKMKLSKLYLLKPGSLNDFQIENIKEPQIKLSTLQKIASTQSLNSLWFKKDMDKFNSLIQQVDIDIIHLPSKGLDIYKLAHFIKDNVPHEDN